MKKSVVRKIDNLIQFRLPRHSFFSRLILMIFLLWPTLAYEASSDPDMDDEQFSSAAENSYQAQKIVSLAPHITELLFSLGVGKRIVGTVSYSDYPAQAKEIRRIGDAANLDMEAILALAPDLVIAWQSGTPESSLSQLESLGFTVYTVPTRGLKGIAENIMELGELVGEAGRAEQQAAEFTRQISQLKKRYAHQQKLSVFYQIWHQPLMTINGEHAIDDVIEVCGGVNLFAGLSTLAPQIGLESVIQRNPDVILISSGASDSDDAAQMWRKWNNVKAVRNGRIYLVPWDLISRQSMRILKGAVYICEALQNARG